MQNFTIMKFKILLPDDVEYFIELEILEKIPVFLELLKYDKEMKEINLPYIDGNIFSTIIMYLRYSIIDPNHKFIVSMFDSLPLKIIIDLIIAANNLGITNLVELLGENFRKIIKENNISDIRKIFKISEDFTIDSCDLNHYIWEEFNDQNL
ncbi:Hypothetical protein KVN_LOCUS534 [uncultured virus]|nr:Hypothetical protein KVN_LOCUS534 [uncultured virus]